MSIDSNTDLIIGSTTDDEWRKYLYVEKIAGLNDMQTIPRRGSAEAVGYDLFSYESGVIPAGESACIGTGLKIVMPPGVYGRIASRSGLSLHHGIEVGAGVIDPDYRGEIKVILRNHSKNDFVFTRDKAIAQLILTPYIIPDVKEIRKIEYVYNDVLGYTKRGSQGFGSTDGK